MICDLRAKICGRVSTQCVPGRPQISGSASGLGDVDQSMVPGLALGEVGAGEGFGRRALPDQAHLDAPSVVVQQLDHRLVAGGARRSERQWLEPGFVEVLTRLEEHTSATQSLMRK